MHKYTAPITVSFLKPWVADSDSREKKIEGV